jgi:hypothetical protein
MNDVNKKTDGLSIVFWILIFGAAFIRLYHLNELSLSNDELSSLSRIKFDSFSEMIRQGVYVDGHPAGLQTFYYFWVKVFGDSDFLLRLPFVFCSILSVVTIYQLGKLWFTRLTGILAATVFAFSPFTIIFTIFARMYSPAVLFCICCVYCWSQFLFFASGAKKLKYLIGWSLFTTLALHLHYFSFLFVAVVGLTGFIFLKKSDVLKYLIAGVISLLLYIPEINIFITQVGRGSIGGWLAPPDKYFLPLFFFELFNRSVGLTIIIIILFLITVSTTKRNSAFRKFRLLSIGWFLISFLTAYLYSLFAQPIIMYSTLLFVTPFILLFIFSYIPEKYLQSKNSIIIASVFIFICSFDSVVLGKYFSTDYFGSFRKVAADADEWRSNLKSDIPVVANVINGDYLNYYFKKWKNPPVLLMSHVETPAEYSQLLDSVKLNSSDYFIYIWCNGSHPLEVPGIIRKYYPYLTARKNYFNAESYLFSRKKSENNVNDLFFNSSCNFENNTWNTAPEFLNTSIAFSPVHSEKVNEFSASYQIPLDKLPSGSYSYFSFSAWIYPLDRLNDAKIVISFERNGHPFNYNATYISEYNIKRGAWNYIIIAAPVPSDAKITDVASVYLWNPGKKIFYADDLSVSVYDGNDPYFRAIH